MRHIILLVILFGNVCFSEAQERPVIGLSDIYKNGGSSVPRSYVEAVLSVDGIPVIIPLMYEEDKIVELLKSLDGIIFTGGEDFAPSYYNETPIPHMNKINAPRDIFDIKLLHLAVEHGIPVLGICRGMQLINIAYGGSLYQDLEVQYPDKSIRHRQMSSKEEPSHAVIVEDGTVFADIVKERTLMVNSSHHQAIKKLARGFRVAGTSPDKIVEVIEKVDSTHWIVGVQFHPEVMINNSLSMRRIFKNFIGEASRLKSEKQRTLYANIAALSVPQSASLRNDELHTPNANVVVSYDEGDDKKKENSDILIRDIHVPDNRKIDSPDKKTEMIDMHTSKERKKSEMRKFKEKEKQHSQKQKEQEELDKQVQKEKERREKEDFKKWVQDRKIEEKEQEQQEKIVKKEQQEKDEAAKKEVAEKEKQRQKELKGKADKDKQTQKEQAKQKKIAEKEAKRQKKTADKEQQEKDEAAKKEAVEKEKQRQKELKGKADKDKQTQKEQAKQKKIAEKETKRQKKTADKEQKEKDEAAKKEAAEKEKQYQKEQKERAKLDEKELKKMEKQKKKEEKEKTS